MQIVHIVEATATGTLSMLSTLANRQAMHHDVTVIYSRRPETPPHLNVWFADQIQLVEIPMGGSIRKVVAAREIRKLLKKIQPRAIFLHSSFAGFVGRMASIALPGFIFYIPHCISFMRKDVGAIARSFFVGLERVANWRKCIYVACSESEAKAIKASIPAAKVEVIENAVESKDIDEIQGDGGELEVFTVITVGQARLQKNPDLFGEIATKVKAEFSSVRFVWVGGGDAEVRTRLAQRGVNVVGWAPRASVFKMVKNATVYLSTSAWEGMPVSLIEAQLAGTPVVAAKCAGNVDVVASGRTGLLYEDAEEGCAAVLSLLRNEGIRRSFAAEARSTALKRFSVERYLAEFESLLAAVIYSGVSRKAGPSIDATDKI